MIGKLENLLEPDSLDHPDHHHQQFASSDHRNLLSHRLMTVVDK
jgi:hypothetical protein